MHVVSRYTAAEAAATIDPRGRAIALSVVIAAGALLLIMPPVIGVTGTLSLLTALIAAFSVGWGFTRGQSWLYRSPLAATRWAFLLSAAGWLLALVAWYGGQDWPALLPAWRAVGRERLSPGALRRVGRRCRDAGQRRHGAERSYRHRGDAADLAYCGRRTPWRLLCLRRAA
ncbi:Uncharacterised protein [Klebsiella pneumoniae]|nr:Uncharacterised protein [Klebsiella pneumoniae]